MGVPTDDADEAIRDGARQDEITAFDELLRRLAVSPSVTPEPWPCPGQEAGMLDGRFEIMRRLGRGGFAVVYEARDAELGRHVAVKLLRPDRVAPPGADGASLLDLFHREAKAAARLNHPNIVTIHDHGIHAGVPYLVLELLVGETLSRRLERGPLLASRATEILLQVAAALAHAHAAGVVHGDLKPGNLFVRDDGQVKILDFGLAHVAHALGGHGIEPAVAGTPGYMAPEQWRGQIIDARTDVFACGVILVEMLCGARPASPPEGGTAERAIASPRMAGIPDDLGAIAERALAPDPGDRFASAQELVEALLRSARSEHELAPGDQPFRYLEQFADGDAAWFFGRRREVARLEQMVAARPLVALIGPSGAGKSSLVQAGLVPRLRRDWTVVAMRPGNEPLRRLHERLVEVCGAENVVRSVADPKRLMAAPGRAGGLLRAHARARSSRILVIVDQLEELVTQVDVAEQRHAFEMALLSLADDAAAPIRVVITARSDFLGKLARNAELGEELARNMMLLGPPGPEALAETLRGPAARAGYEYAPGLVEEMVAAVADEAAPLPLLQLAASRVWERRDEQRRLLSRAALAAAGGVAGILAAHADEVLEGMTDEDVAAARSLLCDLVTEDGTRRRILRDELVARFPDSAAPERVLERLVSGRLVTSYRADGGERLEIAHESLIMGWTLLRGWLDEDRADRQLREKLLAAARLWQERRSPRELLWRGETLEDALRWRRRYRGSLSAAESEFLSTSEARRARGQRARRRLIAAGAALALAISAGSLVAVRASRAAAHDARLRALVTSAAASRDPLLGALLLTELEGQPEPPGGAAAAALLAAQPIPVAVLRQSVWEAPVHVALSPDGGLVATAGAGGKAHIWRLRGAARPVELRGHGAGAAPDRFPFRYAIANIEFSPDGDRVLTAGLDGTARVWRTDGTELVALRHARSVHQARFTPDGTRVLTVCPGEAARLWRADGRGEPIVFRHEAPIAAQFYESLDPLSPDGERVVTVGDDGARLWRTDGQGESVLLAGRGRALTATFSPDGRRLLVRYAREARIWRVDGRGEPVVLPIATPGGDSGGWRRGQAFSPDGARVAAWTGDRIRIHAADGAAPAVELPGRFYSDIALGFSPDGTHLVTVSPRVIQVWPADGRRQPELMAGGPNFRPGRAAFSRDGSRLLTTHGDGLVRIWATAQLAGVRVLRGHGERVNSAHASPDGQLLVTASDDGTARVWPIGGGAPLVLAAGAVRVQGALFTRDGAKVVAKLADGRFLMWPRTGGHPVVLPIRDDPIEGVFGLNGPFHGERILVMRKDGPYLVRGDGSGEPVRLRAPAMSRWLAPASFSPDGSRVAVSSVEAIRIWRMDRPDAPEVVLPIGGADWAAFHPDGKMLVTAGKWIRPELRFWSVDGRELVSFNRMGGTSVAWSPDGESLATGFGNGLVRVERLDRRGEPIDLLGHDSEVVVSFTRDGRLITASADTTARVWLVDWHRLVSALRSATTACLTPAERRQHLGETSDQADAAWARCERRFGRAP